MNFKPINPDSYPSNTYEDDFASEDSWQKMVEELAAEQAAETKQEFDCIETLLGYDLDERSAAWMMSGIAGVYSDVKPVALEHVFDSFIDETDIDLIQSSLRLLDISSEIVVDGPDENGTKMQTWYFSKQPELITKLQSAFREHYPDQLSPEQDANYREIGQLLGYPKTATEYFIRRAHSDNPYSEEPNSAHYIHSPEHAREEYDQYEKPLYAAMQEYCPSSLEVLLQHK